jgi:hypothetical protein
VQETDGVRASTELLKQAELPAQSSRASSVAAELR